MKNIIKNYKKFSLIAVISLGIQNNALANDNACGALLCLAGGVTSGACAPYVAEYFNIFDTNPAKMLTKRLDFLKMCDTNTPPPANLDLPTEVKNALSSKDSDLTHFQNEIVPNLDGSCTKEELNRIEEKKVKVGASYVSYFRINPAPTKSCTLLSSSKYFQKEIKYTCPNDFYTQTDWFNGYTKTYIAYNEYMSLDESKRGSEKKEVLISLAEYKKLPSDLRKMTSSYVDGNKINRYYRIDTLYFKKNIINKDCWEVKDKVS